MNEKRGQGFSVWSIVLIVIGVVVLVFLIYGLIEGWGSLAFWVGSNDNLGDVVVQCRLACARESSYEYCSMGTGLKFEGKDFSNLPCEFLSAGDYGVEECPNLCDFGNLQNAFSGRLEVGKSKNFFVGEDSHKITNLGDGNFKIESDDEIFVSLEYAGDKLLVYFGDDVPDLYFLVKGFEGDFADVLGVDLTGYFNEDEESFVEIEDLIDYDAILDVKGCCSGLCSSDEFSWIPNDFDSDERVFTGAVVDLVDLGEEDEWGDVVGIVKGMGYSDEVANGSLKMINEFSWQRWGSYSDFVESLGRGREMHKKGEISIEMLSDWEMDIASKWAKTIIRNVNYEVDAFDLEDILKSKEANCFGYTQIYIFSGKAMGLNISGMRMDDDDGHMNNIIFYSDGSFSVVDLSSYSVISERVKIGENGWERIGDKIKKGDVVIDIIDTREMVSMIYYSKGFTFFNKGNKEVALMYYNKAIDINPENEAAFNNRGAILLGENKIGEAIGDFSKAIELRREYVSAYQNRGSAYLSLGEYRKAVSDYEKVLDINSEHMKAYMGMAYAHFGLNEFENVVSDTKKIFEKRKDVPIMHYLRGIAYANLGEREKANKDFDRVLELSPDMKGMVEDAKRKYLN